MLEYPEMYTISKQMQQYLIGKVIQSGELYQGNNNLFMGQSDIDNYKLLIGGKVTEVEFHAPEVYIRLDNGYGILFCQCGGKILYHEQSSRIPEKHTIHFIFTDGSALSYTMKLWSLGIFAMKWEDWESRKNAKNLYQPLTNATAESFIDFVQSTSQTDPLPAKTFLSKFVAGIMSSLAGDILLLARVHPSKKINILSEDELRRIFDSMQQVLNDACEKEGRASEVNLLGVKGRYAALTERKNIGEPCPNCGNTLQKISVGGITVYCPVCQVKK